MTSVLMYHAIIANNDENEGADPHYSVAEPQFLEQMKTIERLGYVGSSTKDALSNPKRKNVVITFDDGHITNYSRAFPILREMGFTADFYVNSSTINTQNICTWDHLRDMHQHGMSIQSHGHTHRYFDELNDQETRQELSQSKNLIEKKLASHVDIFAPPGGRHTKNTIKIAKELGYTTLSISKPGIWGDQTSDIIPRYAMLQSTNLNTFAKMVTANRIFALKKEVLYWSLWLTKRAFGNKNYDKIRRALLRQN